MTVKLPGIQAQNSPNHEGSGLKAQSFLEGRTPYHLPFTVYRYAGFTLVEFLIVAAIIGVLTGFGIPQFTTYSKRQTLVKATDQVINDLKTVQNMGLSGVQDDPDGYTVTSFYLEKTGINTYELKRERVNGSPIPNTIYQSALDSPTFFALWPEIPLPLPPTPIKIKFNVPTGKLTSECSLNCVIRVCYTGVGYYDITIEPSGRIYREPRGGPPC